MDRSKEFQLKVLKMRQHDEEISLKISELARLKIEEYREEGFVTDQERRETYGEF